ncbi:hypothetical protein Mgra_00005431 [Meloidogyne graminicola]|uniref:Uncharacterized protein n=1 Tax=Meloidogyne graminicola TaxID=189291 RepID=A0A8S9ZPS9_9BILA|nr:hypothetical protein Mgra_00005431 [Meloidogyne graminicola]
MINNNNLQNNNINYYKHQHSLSSTSTSSSIITSFSPIKISKQNIPPKIQITFPENINNNNISIPPLKPVRGRTSLLFNKKDGGGIKQNKNAQINWKRMGEAVLSTKFKQKMTSDCSLKIKSNIVFPKKRYSTWRKDSLRDFQTPTFNKKEHQIIKSVPSSLKTVMALSGLFVCGLMLLISGIIVIFSQKDFLFRIVGLGLSLLGLLFLLICALIQRKNVGKWFSDMSRDLFALKEAQNVIENIEEINNEKRQSFSVIDELPDTFIR